MQKLKTFLLAFMMVFAMVAFTGCKKDTGDHLEDAADSIGDSMEDIGDNIGDMVDDAVD